MKETILRIIKDLMDKHNGITSDYILECLIALGYTKNLIFIALAELDTEYYAESRDVVEVIVNERDLKVQTKSYDTWFDSYVQMNF